MENYQRRDDISFDPHADSSHRLIEISRNRPFVNPRSLSDSELSTILNEQPTAPKDNPQLQILLSPPAKSDGVNFKKMPYSRDAYETIAKNWNIPSCFPIIVSQHVPVGGLRIPSSPPNGTAYIFKSEVNWAYQFALCVSRPSPTTTCCLCIGLRPSEYSSALIPMLMEFVHLAPEHQLLVPICLLSITCHNMSEFAGSCQDGLWNVQKETGLYGRRANEEPTSYRPENFNRLIRQLTGMSDTYARTLSRIATVRRMVGVVDEALKYSLVKGEEATDELTAQMRWIKQMVDGSEHYVKWFQSSSADQMKTIAHFTQQHDNYLNLQLVKQSSRDGTNMSRISLVTLIFLPGTFAATMFSMSFFDFKPNDGARVSVWFWLYWVVTAGMTAGVLALFWWRVAKVEAQDKKKIEEMDSEKTK